MAEASLDTHPMFGLPMAVKDSFDAAGLTTTEGCRAFAHVAADTDPRVTRLLQSGAILIGKNNMDQFGVSVVGRRGGHPGDDRLRPKGPTIAAVHRPPLRQPAGLL